MRIGIIGSGSVARSLGRGFVRTGHEVMVGTRDPAKPKLSEWLGQVGPAGSLGSYVEAAAFGDVVVFAVPGRTLPEVVAGLDARDFEGKVIIDPTNPPVITAQGVENAFGDNDSGAEYLARALPGAHIVKAFSQIVASEMNQPTAATTMPLRVASDDADAKQLVSDLAAAMGWKVRDIGALSRARALENAAVEWMRGG